MRTPMRRLAPGALFLMLSLSACQPPPSATEPATKPVATPALVTASPQPTVDSSLQPRAAPNQPECASFDEPAILRSVEAPAKELQAPNPTFAPRGLVPDYFLGRPPSASADRALRVLLAVHGVASNGSDFAAPLVPISQPNGWLLIAPTLRYHNHNSAIETRADDVLLFEQLDAVLADVPRRTGLRLEPKILALGFSRGAGLLERYAMARPERIAALASIASGAYTLPQACAEAAGQRQPLPFPLGTADFQLWTGRGLDRDAVRRIPLWVAVGARDVTEAPAPWDTLLGRTRLERAAGYVRQLHAFGRAAEYRAYPGVKHEITKPQLQDAADFLAQMA